MERKRTATSNFGAGKRESHDASAFYGRFASPELSTDAVVPAALPIVDPFIHGDSRHLDSVGDGQVALVVTSPPYFAGKQYEEELERDGIPSSYAEYLTLLTEVFDECKRALEPGGRIAVNIANLGRKPYRSLSADVTDVLQRLGLLMRGEVIWRKGEGASGSCAWGSYRSPANPVLRDLTERVVIASKGRFDRAVPQRRREELGLPHRSTVTADEFMASTLDVWEIAPESARRVNHPAPFPVGLPERLIHLYTYEDDLVLDPFMGSGSTMVAASRTRRRFVGCDLDESYVGLARRRVADEGAPPDHSTFEVRPISAVAEQSLVDAGFVIDRRDARIRGAGTAVSFIAHDTTGRPWWFDLNGALTTSPSGLARIDTVWRTLGRAAVLGKAAGGARLVLLTSHLPRPGSEPQMALRAAGPSVVHDVIAVGSADGSARLARYAAGQTEPEPGFWTERDLST